MIIKELNKEDKPREKLMLNGAKHLTNSELISLILSKGTKNLNILELSQKLIKDFSLSKLKEIEFEELIQIKGIGESKACQLIGAIELGKRISTHEEKYNKTINSPKKAFQELRNSFSEDQESLIALFLNSRNQLICKKTIFVGTINKQIVSPREIIKHAIATKAVNIILAHNHPSGNLTPSNADIKTTDKIQRSLNLFELNLNDHIILTSNNFFSMKENFLL